MVEAAMVAVDAVDTVLAGMAQADAVCMDLDHVRVMARDALVVVDALIGNNFLEVEPCMHVRSHFQGSSWK
jgi:hypothetical protein